MTTQGRSLCASVILLALVTIPTPALANGLAFFRPADGGVVDLVYFGQIKGPNGEPLSHVELAVETTSRYMYEIQFDQDKPGHFRSPDIGALYKQALQTVDPATITITARKYGYQTVTRRVPLRAAGVLRVDFTLQPEAGAPGPPSRGMASRAILIGALCAALVIAVGARRASRQTSTADSDRALA